MKSRALYGAVQHRIMDIETKNNKTVLYQTVIVVVRLLSHANKSRPPCVVATRVLAHFCVQQQQ